MTRYLIIATALLSLPPLTDWLVDQNFHRHASETAAYTRQQRDAMSALVERAVANPVILTRDTGMASATQPECGLNWLCLLDIAERQHPTKHKKGRRS